MFTNVEHELHMKITRTDGSIEERTVKLNG